MEILVHALIAAFVFIGFISYSTSRTQWVNYLYREGKAKGTPFGTAIKIVFALIPVTGELIMFIHNAGKRSTPGVLWWSTTRDLNLSFHTHVLDALPVLAGHSAETRTEIINWLTKYGYEMAERDQRQAVRNQIHPISVTYIQATTSDGRWISSPEFVSNDHEGVASRIRDWKAEHGITDKCQYNVFRRTNTPSSRWRLIETNPDTYR